MKTTRQNVSVCAMRLAVRRPGKADETDYINVVAWRSLGENCSKWLAKGRKVGVSGYISTRDYEGQHGKVYVTEVVADDVEFLTPKDSSMPQRSEDRGAPPPTEDDIKGMFDNEEFEVLDDEQMPF